MLFQLLILKVEGPPGYFLMKPDKETPEKTSELSSEPEEIIYYFPSNQSALMAPCDFVLYNLKPACHQVVKSLEF